MGEDTVEPEQTGEANYIVDENPSAKQTNPGSLPKTEPPMPSTDEQNAEVAKPKKRGFVSLKKRFARVGTWLVFSVACAIFPFCASWLITRAVKEPYNPEEILAHGELIAISLALTGEALGSLLFGVFASILHNGTGNRSVLVLVCKFALVVASGSILLASMGLLGGLTVDDANVDAGFVMWVSVVFFICTLAVGFFCKWLEE